MSCWVSNSDEDKDAVCTRASNTLSRCPTREPPFFVSEIPHPRLIDTPNFDTDIYVDDSAHVHPSATLVGLVVVDSDAVIEAGTVIQYR